MLRKENLVLTYGSGEALFRDQCFWVFVNSFLKNVSNADLIILTHDMPEDARDALDKLGVTVVDVSAKDIHFLYRDRHLSFYKYLNDHGHKYKHVLVSDCRDVLFQSNPFDWIGDWKARHDNIKGCHTFLSHFVILMAEGFKMAQSGFACIEHFEFQRDVPMPYMKDDKNRWVVNGGTYLGTPRALQDWHFLVWITTMKTIGRCTDQATVNWLMHYLEDDDTYQVSFPQHDHLCLTGEGVKEGAVEPILKDGILHNPQGKPYHLIHQWDRGIVLLILRNRSWRTMHG
jgi:hypothetical protein